LFSDKTPVNLKMKEQEQPESWAIFEPDEALKQGKELSTTPTNSKITSKQLNPEKESPYSSDGKNESKQREKEYHRRWPKAHTSSSSRDVSPYEDSPHSGDSKRRPKPHHESHHSVERYNRSDEYGRRNVPSRLRSSKASVYRSKEVLDSENSNWHYPSPSEHWSDEDDTERKRSFDRNELRSTYGPVYDNKRDPKSLSYERRDYRTHEKRSKYYRTNRNDYEYDPYEMPPPVRTKPSKKNYDDYEDFERVPPRNAREYFYDRERKSFDSNESYDSGRGHRLGSGDICGSYEGNRVDYRDRERYVNRSFRRNQRTRDGDTDTEEDAPRRPSNETGSLQRPSASNQRSKHIQLDDDIWGVGTSGKNWKRPSSASAVIECLVLEDHLVQKVKKIKNLGGKPSLQKERK
jgi:disabled homolog 2